MMINKLIIRQKSRSFITRLKSTYRSAKWTLLISLCLALLGCNNSQDLAIDSASPELLNNYFLYTSKITIVDGSAGFAEIASTVEIAPDPDDEIWGKFWLNKELEQKSKLGITAAQILDCDHPEDTSNALRCSYVSKGDDNWFEIRQANSDETVAMSSDSDNTKQSISVLRDQLIIEIQHDSKRYWLVGEFDSPQF